MFAKLSIKVGFLFNNNLNTLSISFDRKGAESSTSGEGTAATRKCL